MVIVIERNLLFYGLRNIVVGAAATRPFFIDQ